MRVLFLLDQFSLPPARKPCSWDFGRDFGFALPALLSYFTLLIFFALIGDRRCSSTSAAAATGIYTSPPSSWGFSMQREILIPFSVSVAARSSRVSCQSGRSFSAPSFLFLQAWGGVSGFRPSCVHQLFFVLPFRLSGSPPPRRGLIFVACRIFFPPHHSG